MKDEPGRAAGQANARCSDTPALARQNVLQSVHVVMRRAITMPGHLPLTAQFCALQHVGAACLARRRT